MPILVALTCLESGAALDSGPCPIYQLYEPLRTYSDTTDR